MINGTLARSRLARQGLRAVRGCPRNQSGPIGRRGSSRGDAATWIWRAGHATEARSAAEADDARHPLHRGLKARRRCRRLRQVYQKPHKPSRRPRRGRRRREKRLSGTNEALSACRSNPNGWRSRRQRHRPFPDATMYITLPHARRRPRAAGREDRRPRAAHARLRRR